LRHRRVKLLSVQVTPSTERELIADSTVIPSSFDAFFRRWKASGGPECARYSMFSNDRCNHLEVSRPDPSGPDDEKNAYGFERARPCRRVDVFVPKTRVCDVFAFATVRTDGRRGRLVPGLAKCRTPPRFAVLGV